MKTNELRKALRKLDEDGQVEVIMACDEEGNHFNTIDDESFDFIDNRYLVLYPAKEIDPFGDDFYPEPLDFGKEV